MATKEERTELIKKRWGGVFSRLAAPPGGTWVAGDDGTTCYCQQCQESREGMCVVMPSHGCGNKRCPKSIDHRYKCTNSNDPGQVGEIEDGE